MAMNAPKSSGLPSFENPPVIEVVCGIQFKPLSKLCVPHYGLLWEQFKSSYPNCEEVTPLPPSFEPIGRTQGLKVELSGVPPLPRVWFTRKNNSGIIQVQRDRFMHNWCKANSEDEYPRYHNVIRMFKSHLDEFSSFLEKNQLGSIVPTQYEMTYVNHIYKGDGWECLNDISKIFPDFTWQSGKERFLPDIENINWRTTFLLPDQMGRLYVSISNGFLSSAETPVIRMDLTVRGMDDTNSDPNTWFWFDTARKWIVRGFSDLTSEEAQKTIWGKK